MGRIGKVVPADTDLLYIEAAPMNRISLLSIVLSACVVSVVSAQGVSVRTGRMGPLVTSELQPVAPAKAPATPPANANAFQPGSGKLLGLKWQSPYWFEDGEGRRWRRVAGLPTLPLPSEMTGWALLMNDGREYFYSNTGQLFALCVPTQAAQPE
jgi:hypothetical protein